MDIVKILDFLKNYWVLITAFLSFIGIFFTFIKSSIEANKCSLRNDILTIYDRAVERGGITHYELEALTHSADVYFKLGGNSFVKVVVEKAKEFTITDK